MFKTFIITYIEKRIAQHKLTIYEFKNWVKERNSNYTIEINGLEERIRELNDLIQIINNFKD